MLARFAPHRRLPAFLAKLLSNERQEATLPLPGPKSEWAPLINTELPPVRGSVRLLEGCAMKMLFPRVHTATQRLLRRVGYEAEFIDGCCGALHAHNGSREHGELLAHCQLGRVSPDWPLIVNSAGCGSHLKEQCQEDNVVYDVSEFLLNHGLTESLQRAPGLPMKVAYHDACHLVHGQKVASQPLALLEAIPGLELISLVEADMCCGSAGIYNLLEPSMARRLLDRKWRNIAQTGADVVALGNPGCHAWIAQAAQESHSGIRVMHTAELLESAFSGLPDQ